MYPYSLPLWGQLFEYHLDQADTQTAMEIFEQAIPYLKHDRAFFEQMAGITAKHNLFENVVDNFKRGLEYHPNQLAFSH